MSTPVKGSNLSPPLPNLPPPPFAGKPTWLCTFSVTIDLPTTMDTPTMEGAVAQGLAAYLQSVGLPGNVVAQLMSTAGNTTVLSCGAPATVGVSAVPVTPIIRAPV